MNWDAVGAVGKMIGALAVVVTLGYLSLQIRASRAESNASNIGALAENARGVRDLFVQHAELWIKGNAGVELSAAEQLAFDELVEARSDRDLFSFLQFAAISSRHVQVPAATLGLFLHQHPVAYARWRAQQAAYTSSRRRMGIDPTEGDDWLRMVTEAVAALELMEESAPA
jgi:hypothetical protein